MAKEIIGFINKNNDIFNLKEDPSTSKYCHKVGQGHENKIATFTEDGDLKDSEYEVEDFAQAEHSHSQLILPATLDPTEYNRIDLEETEHQGKIYIRLYDTEDEDSVFSDYITGEKLSNIFYPATAPVQGNQKLITSDAVYTALQEKADKVINAIPGHIVSLDTNSNLVDSGVGIDTIIEEGNTDLVPSGTIYDALQGKADSEHSHNIITDQASGGRTALFEVDATSKTAILELNDGTTYKSAEINMNNIDNLNRALQGPQVPTQGSNKYSTSSQIYTFVKGMLSKELTLEYGAKVSNMWELLDVSDNQEFFNLIPYNTPVSIKFKCNKQAGQTSDVSQHNFYVYGSLQINLEGQDDEKIAYIYINNAVYQCSLGRLDGQDWVYLDTATLIKLQEDPFF